MVNYKKILPVFLVIIILSLAWYFLSLKKDTEIIKSTETTLKENEQPPVPEREKGKLPPFIMADVTGLNGSTIDIKIGDKPESVSVTKDTVVTEQVKDGTGFKNIEASITDIKVKQRIVIFYKQGSAGEYLAEKIQILNF